MILVAGLTPAWQQIYTFRHFRVGEVNRANSMAACASGKVLNVGCALFHLQAKSKTICPIGGSTGQLIKQDYERLGIPVRWIPSEVTTRICTTILDDASAATTEMVENSHPLPSHELDQYLEAFHDESSAADVVVMSGSLPTNTPPDYYRRLLEPIKVATVLDIRGEELKHVLPLGPFVIKPNREELGKTVGRALETDDELVEAMSEMRRRGAEWVVISQGGSTLFALGPDGLLKVEPPKVKVRNPIGCGDCLAAGIAAGIDRKMSMFDALQLGVRAAAENAAELLPARKLTGLP